MVYGKLPECVKYDQISTLKIDSVSVHLLGKDVIGVLPTGFRYLLPHVLPPERALRNILLIVCPLNSTRVRKNFEQISLVNSSSQSEPRYQGEGYFPNLNQGKCPRN